MFYLRQPVLQVCVASLLVFFLFPSWLTSPFLSKPLLLVTANDMLNVVCSRVHFKHAWQENKQTERQKSSYPSIFPYLLLFSPLLFSRPTFQWAFFVWVGSRPLLKKLELRPSRENERRSYRPGWAPLRHKSRLQDFSLLLFLFSRLLVT